jgi:hypothetical protein
MTPQLTVLAELEHAIAHGSSQQRAKILMQVAELFIRDSARYSDDEISLFDDYPASRGNRGIRAVFACAAPCTDCQGAGQYYANAGK